MPAPGTVWATGTWDSGAWAADTWAGAVASDDLTQLLELVIVADRFLFPVVSTVNNVTVDTVTSGVTVIIT
jgi:hypothetical protein